MSGPAQRINIDTGRWLGTMTFSAKGEHLVSGHNDGVRVWRVADATLVTTLEAKGAVRCLAASVDGAWIAAGTQDGHVVVWDAKTFKEVSAVNKEGLFAVSAVDFSANSERLVSASNCRVTIWDIVPHKEVRKLQHGHDWVVAARYSPRGDRIATASSRCIYVWDSATGSQLASVPVSVIPQYNRALCWFNNRLFVVSSKAIKELDASTGRALSEWSAPGTSIHSCIALPNDGQFVLCSTKEGTITFWDTWTHSQLVLIRPLHDVCSIAFSPDGRRLAVGGEDGKLTIKRISRTTSARESAPSRTDAPTRCASPTQPLNEWAVEALTNYSWRDALLASASSKISRASVHRALCQRLETINRMSDAVKCFLQLTSELGGETCLCAEDLEWALDFKQRSRKKSEHFGDEAAGAQRYKEAISHYSTALSLNPHSPQSVLIKRSKAFMAAGSSDQALDDADQARCLDLAILDDPSSPWGYEMKHTVLHEAGNYEKAIDAFEMMLSKLAHSSDPNVEKLVDQYISPSDTRAAIRKIVERTIRHSPRVLIDTTTGYLLDRAELVSAFEALPIFNELVSLMTRRISYSRIKREVRQCFRYVMLSHKWEDNEPLYQQVIHKAVYNLDKSPTHEKLQNFCRIVRDAGYRWAWSDTCCINKSDHFVLQEALVAMFEWYQGSALTIIYLRGVRSWSQLGALVKSIWNKRAWTLQEYIASKVVHFYTEDWTLYLNLKIPNHKDSPEIVSEMERATGVAALQLRALRPGLTNICEKLRLASSRQTTLVEDAAYSLLGIFSIKGIPAIYGEGEAALGRLLANLVTISGDVSALAWTGESGSFSSLLPAHITVFKRPATSHIPQLIPDAELTSASQTLSFDLGVAFALYDRLNELPTPLFAACRMKLPCIAFELPSISCSHRDRANYFYYADTVAFGMVKFKSRQGLSQLDSVFLVHPWLDALIGREESGSIIECIEEPDDDDENDEEESSDEEKYWSPLPEPLADCAPMHTAPKSREVQAQQLVARLRQPFGALLLTSVSMTGRMDFKRAAADSLITVRFQESVSLSMVLDNVRILDVL